MTATAAMLCRDLKQQITWGADDPFTGIAGYLTTDWAAEPKLDGCRAELVIGAERWTPAQSAPSATRFGGSRSASFPALASIASADLAGTVLDGEFLAPRRGPGGSLLNASAGLFGSGPAHAARMQAMYGPAEFHVFDVTAIANADVTRLSYAERRRHLEVIAEWIGLAYPAAGVRLVPQLPATTETILQVLAGGAEGVVLKRLAGRYRPGDRSWDWVKVKRFSTVDCFLTGGYKPGKNSRVGTVGAVEIGVVTADGGVLVIGHCAVPPAWAAAVTAADGSLRPEMTGTVIEVIAQGIGVNGLLRHPHLGRLRPDKLAADCDVDQLAGIPRV
jgi:ATP-dependent DNA ligase